MSNNICRWLRTPLDEAIQFGHDEVANLLREKGGVTGRGIR